MSRDIVGLQHRQHAGYDIVDIFGLKSDVYDAERCLFAMTEYQFAEIAVASQQKSGVGDCKRQNIFVQRSLAEYVDRADDIMSGGGEALG